MSNLVSILLKPLTADNWQKCADLTVHENQKSFIPSNLHSIAAAQFYPDNCCRAIYANDQIVGLTLYGIEQGTNRIKLFRLMIAAPFQHRGYGSAALRAVLADIGDRWSPSRIYVSYQNQNSIARQLYAKFDFHEVERTGEKITACKQIQR